MIINNQNTRFFDFLDFSFLWLSHISILNNLPFNSSLPPRTTFTTAIYVRHQLTSVPVTFHAYSPYIALLYHYHYTSIHVVQEIECSKRVIPCNVLYRVTYEFSCDILKSTYTFHIDITHTYIYIYTHKHDVSSILETEWRAELGNAQVG